MTCPIGLCYAFMRPINRYSEERPEMSAEHYPVRAGALGGRYVIAKLGKQRTAREYLVQATDDDRIIVSEGYGAKGTIGIFEFSGKGRLCTKGAHFPHLALAEPFEFPAEFVRTCIDIAHPLGAETSTTCATVAHTVKVI